MKLSTSRSGFTLIELVVVVLVLAALAGALVPRVTNQGASARDARRLSDIKTVVSAIEQYFLDTGRYPVPHKNGGFGGWDVSQDGTFIPELVNKGYLREHLKDPLNDNTYHYRYYVYNKGQYGCQGNGPYYVIGIRKFETEEAVKKNKGFFRCNNRDWGREFQYVTGGGASIAKAGR